MTVRTGPQSLLHERQSPRLGPTSSERDVLGPNLNQDLSTSGETVDYLFNPDILVTGQRPGLK